MGRVNCTIKSHRIVAGQVASPGSLKLVFRWEIEGPSFAVETCPDLDIVKREIGVLNFLTNEWLLSYVGESDQDGRVAGHVESPVLERLRSRVTIYGRDHLLASIVGHDRIDQAQGEP